MSYYNMVYIQVVKTEACLTPCTLSLPEWVASRGTPAAGSGFSRGVCARSETDRLSSTRWLMLREGKEAVRGVTEGLLLILLLVSRLLEWGWVKDRE